MLGLLLLATGAGAEAAPPAPSKGPDGIAPGAADAAAIIRPEAVSAHIRFLADDLLEGRLPGERGYDIAAVYVASQLQGLGLEPAGDGGSWYQAMTLRRTDHRGPSRWDPGRQRALVPSATISPAPHGSGVADVTAGGLRRLRHRGPSTAGTTSPA